MTTPRDHGTHVDAWLQRPSAPGGAVYVSCLDAETAAAWLDGGLSIVALEQARDHVAGCARCQALLGTVARASENPVTVAVAELGPAWRRWFTWAMPLAGAAAAAIALAVWVRTPAPPSVPGAVAAPASTVESSQAPALQADGRDAKGIEPRAPVLAAPERAAPDLADSSAAASPPSRTESAARASVPGSSPSPRDSAAPQSAPVRQEPPGATTAGGAAAAADAREKVAQGTATAPAPAASGALNEVITVPDNAPPQLRSDAVAPSVMTMRAPAPPRVDGWTVVTATGASRRWRFLGDQVQDSTNGGTSWNPVALAAPGRILAGSTPGPSVCWLVGRSGLVWLTTDGEHWARLGGPESSDLMAVTAISATSATVVTTAGRSFTTVDSGRTWTPR